MHGHMRLGLLKLRVTEGSIATSDELRQAVRIVTSISAIDL